MLSTNVSMCVNLMTQMTALLGYCDYYYFFGEHRV